MIDNSNLVKYVDILRDAGICDREDVIFAEKLTAIRNGIAHRKPQKVANTLGIRFRMVDLYTGSSNVSAAPLIVDGMFLVSKTLYSGRKQVAELKKRLKEAAKRKSAQK
jgi:hypothetical protein